LKESKGKLFLFYIRYKKIKNKINKLLSILLTSLVSNIVHYVVFEIAVYVKYILYGLFGAQTNINSNFSTRKAAENSRLLKSGGGNKEMSSIFADQ
jgi:hypothetical protein